MVAKCSSTTLTAIYVNGTSISSGGGIAASISGDNPVGYVVAKIEWGTADMGDASTHTITVWKLGTGDLTSAPTTGGSTRTGLNFNQANIGIVSFQDNKAVTRVDQIRLAPTFADLVGAATRHVIPEPATMGLLAMGGLGVLWRRRRK